MDFNEIKEIIKKTGGKFIIVEEGNPEMVIMSFEDFKKGLAIESTKANFKKEEQKREIDSFPTSSLTPQLVEKQRIPKELEEEPLKIEDLPF